MSAWDLVDGVFGPPLVSSGTLPVSDDLSAAVAHVLSTLDAREQVVLRARYGLDGPRRTWAAIGAGLHRAQGGDIGLDRKSVPRIAQRALRKLRHPSRACYLRSFADRASPSPDPPPVP